MAKKLTITRSGGTTTIAYRGTTATVQHTAWWSAPYATAPTGKTGKVVKVATDWELLGNALGAQPAAYTRESAINRTPAATPCDVCGKARKNAKMILTRSHVVCPKCYDEATHGEGTNRTRSCEEIAADEDAYDAYLYKNGREHAARKAIMKLFPNGYPDQGFDLTLAPTQIRHKATIAWREEQRKARQGKRKSPKRQTARKALATAC